MRTDGHTPRHASDRNLGRSIFPMTCSGNVTKASGIVRLPNHIFWSGDPLDLTSLTPRIGFGSMNWSSEGNDDDIRFYVDPEEPVNLWPRLFLPTYVPPLGGVAARPRCGHLTLLTRLQRQVALIVAGMLDAPDIGLAGCTS